MNQDVVYVQKRLKNAHLVSVFKTENLAKIAEKVVIAETRIAMGRAGRGRGSDPTIVGNPKTKVKGERGRWK